VEAWQIVALSGVVIIVLAKWMRFGASRPPEKEWIKAMDEAFDHFAAEMEAENKQVIEHVSSLKNKYEQEMQALSRKMAALEERCAALNKELLQLRQAPLAPADGALPAQAQAPGADIRGRFPEVFSLYDAGKSIEYIAKKTGMNKGEIQLIVTLASKEEQSRV
jgi:predicted RNase H-like nuclease (RuvC/YqgF family)